MTWTAPITFVPNTVLTASQLNTYLRDNMLETMPAKASIAGSLFVTSGQNQISQRQLASGFIGTQESTDATEWVDLATVGPSVTVQTSARAFVFLFGAMWNTSGKAAWTSYEVSGATDSPVNNNRAIMMQQTQSQRIGACILHQNLTAGLNTFTLKYRVSVSGTGSWKDRRIAVIPL